MTAVNLSGLSTREAVADVVYRCVNAFDTADYNLLESALTEDCVGDLAGTKMTGLETLKKESFDRVSKLDTTHFVTNVRVDLKGETKATLTATATARHYRAGEGTTPGATHFTSGGLYTLECVKDGSDGSWKANYWGLKLIWFEGDFGVMSGN